MVDLHATEIFEYAVKLASNRLMVPVSRSLDYQICRLQYAKMMFEYGGFAQDAFRYCVEIARAIWNRCDEIDIQNLEDLCDLVERYFRHTTVVG